ncbi:MAG TPA: transglycosylase SLT domain-containing protein [Gammaproteobacteria bacterium]|nr:transglycosylase SLT domain-containing protein [Gammaproteobacteria bacterium]
MKFRTLFVLLLAGFATARAAEPVAERARFRTAYDAALAGRDAQALAHGLEHYPLYPYLEYLRLRSRLASLPVAQIEDFLKREGSTYLGERLRGEWLRQLGQLHQWALLVRYAAPTDNAILGCLQLRARLETGRLNAVTPDVEKLWLVGNSQIDACDEPFEHLRRIGALDESLALKRAWLALGQQRTKLAGFLLRRFAGLPLKDLDAVLKSVKLTPASFLAQPALQRATPRTRALIGVALVDLAGSDAGRAQALWRAARLRHTYAEQEAAVILRAIALGATNRQHPERRAMLANVPASGLDAIVERARIREALLARDWHRLADWTAAPAATPSNALRWRYWHARAIEALGEEAAAMEAYRAVAGERDYYGFLASDRLGVDYTLNHRAVAADAADRARLAVNPGLLRAREFYRLGLRQQANQEWQWLITHLPRRDVEIAARLAHEWGWHDRAIVALGAVQSYDDLELRFPLLFERDVRSAAQRRGLPPALVYSIIRGESAFVVDARSSAGALGLMQMLPTTGEETARHLGLPWKSESELLMPGKNIQLGSEYLRRVLRQFGGSFPLAAAAYNAGPGRVKSWLPKSGCVPADVWVELIPFVETEGYVRRALFYAAVYEHRMGERLTPLSTRLADLTPDGANGSCSVQRMTATAERP